MKEIKKKNNVCVYVSVRVCLHVCVHAYESVLAMDGAVRYDECDSHQKIDSSSRLIWQMEWGLLCAIRTLDYSVL